MKISVAVPSMNYGRYLRACLESIAGQTHRDFEVLIADGGSSDDSLSIIAEFMRADPRFHLVSTSDAGQSDGINKALAHASGDVHCYLNADDQYLCNDAFEAAVDAFAAYAIAEVIAFTGWYIEKDGRPIRPARLRHHPRDNFGWMKRRTAVLQPSTFWRAHVSRQIPFDASLHFTFDSLFFYKASLGCNWMEFLKPIAGARIHGENKSATLGAQRVREIAQLEAVKYGKRSWRVTYLRCLAVLVALCWRVPSPWFRRVGPQAIRVCANSLAYLSFYHAPGI